MFQTPHNAKPGATEKDYMAVRGRYKLKVEQEKANTLKNIYTVYIYV